MFGFSIFTTSAPSQPRASVQDGPASNWVKSTTFTPSRKAKSETLADMRTSLGALLDRGSVRDGRRRPFVDVSRRQPGIGDGLDDPVRSCAKRDIARRRRACQMGAG